MKGYLVVLRANFDDVPMGLYDTLGKAKTRMIAVKKRSIAGTLTYPKGWPVSLGETGHVAIDVFKLDGAKCEPMLHEDLLEEGSAAA